MIFISHFHFQDFNFLFNIQKASKKSEHFYASCLCVENLFEAICRPLIDVIAIFLSKRIPLPAWIINCRQRSSIICRQTIFRQVFVKLLHVITMEEHLLDMKNRIQKIEQTKSSYLISWISNEIFSSSYSYSHDSWVSLWGKASTSPKLN